MNNPRIPANELTNNLTKRKVCSQKNYLNHRIFKINAPHRSEQSTAEIRLATQSKGLDRNSLQYSHMGGLDYI